MQNVNISFARFASGIKERLEETVAQELCRLEKVAVALETLKVGLKSSIPLKCLGITF
jgi:hypothetical protein